MITQDMLDEIKSLRDGTSQKQLIRSLRLVGINSDEPTLQQMRNLTRKQGKHIIGTLKKAAQRKAHKYSKRYVYFISDGEYVKIGIATNVKDRLSNLQVGHLCKLEVIVIIPGTLETEQYYHKKFRRYRSHGEWFKLSRPLIDEILHIKSYKMPVCLNKKEHTYGGPIVKYNKPPIE